MAIRGVHSSVTDIRRRVFTEVARLAYEGGDYSRIEEIPYKIVPGERASYRNSIFLERAIVGERLRLAIGLPLRSVEQHAPVYDGVVESAIAEKYYDPPLVNVIKFACNACPEKQCISQRCARTVWNTPAGKSARSTQFPVKTGKVSLTRMPVLNAAAALQSALTTQLLR